MPKSKFTRDRREQIIQLLRAGNTTRTACRMAGVDPSTLYKWLRRGGKARAGSTFRQFYEDVQRAEGEAEVRAQLHIQQGMRDDPKWAAWYLERRRPDQWGRRSRHEVSGPEGERIRIELEWPAEPQPPSEQ